MRIDKCNCGDKLKTKDGRMAVYLGIAYSKEQEERDYYEHYYKQMEEEFYKQMEED